MSALAGAVFTAPVWLYQFWAFIVPGLLAKEKRWALAFIGAATPMFAGGVAVGYLVLPKAMVVLLGFTQSGVANLQDINAYLAFSLRLMIVFGIAFLLPLVVLMLNIVGVVKAKHLAKYRTYVIFGTFVFGAIATPSTDPFSMLALAAPMTVLFLAAEAIAHLLDRRKARRAVAAGDDLAISRQRRSGSCPAGARRARVHVTRRIRLVVNPSSGKGRALEMLPQVAGKLRDGGDELEVLLSRDLPEAHAMAAGAVSDGVDVLAVMGGDGMMHLGLNAAAPPYLAGKSRTALGLIPAGTGNDLCRGIGLDPFDAVAAAAVIAAGRTRALDLAMVDTRFVGAVLATGFDAYVNRRANEMVWPRGSSRYTLATLAELRVFEPLRYRLTLDGEVRDLPAMLVAVGNTSSYGGGMKICPRADPWDGLLDVTIIHPVGRLKLLRLLPQMFSGRFARDPCVEQLRVRTVRVEGYGLVGFGDGEMIGAAPLNITCEPRALPVFVPPPA